MVVVVKGTGRVKRGSTNDFPCQAFRTHALSCQQVITILGVAPPACLDEFTTGGQPAGVTALHMLCGGADRFAEREQIVRELIRLSAICSMRHQKTGATPILRAAGSGSTDLVRLLLELRADANVPNKDGLTPLDAAAMGQS